MHHMMSTLLFKEQDKSFDIEQQPLSGDPELSNTLPQMRGIRITNHDNII